MAGRVIDCPNCGGQVEFKAGSSLLAVCGYCSSAVARVGDDITELEILGKVAPLAEVGSPLSVGTQGQLHGKDFFIVGRLQLNHGDGPWNEWYLAFDDGRWAWLAEAQGRVYITFAKDLEELKQNNPRLTVENQLPGFEHWSAGTQFHFGGQTHAIKERRTARFVSAEGELPFAVPLESEFKYCDFEGARGIFGTLDFGDTDEVQSIYYGREHEYEGLFDKDTLDRVEESQAAAAVAMNCPNCGAAVELQAPNESERVTCGTCESLLDCSKGNELSLLKSEATLKKEPLIPLGSEAEYQGETWTVFGYLLRSVTFYDVNYPWEEYLLRGKKGGYRWLICSEGHWTWVDPVSAAEVETRSKGRRAKYRGHRFRHYQTATARVDALRGEFYWKVKIGEEAETMDYISPPQILGYQRSQNNGEEEIHWSLGHYLTVEQMSEMFRDKVSFPRSSTSTVAPHEPNRYAEMRKRVSNLGMIFSAVLILAAVVLSSMKPSGVLFETTKQLNYYKKTDTDAAAQATVLTEPFEITNTTNLDIRLSSDVSNNWLFVNAALINEAKGEVRYFTQQTSYYFGRSGGESWKEGSRTNTVSLGSVAPGTYRMSFSPQLGAPRKNNKSSSNYSIRVKQGTFYKSHLIFFLLLVWAFPLFVRGRYNRFEHRRWADSDYG